MYRIYGPGGGSGSGSSNIPEVTVDPVAPANGDAWVLREDTSSGALSHSIAHIGLLLVPTTSTYFFSYKTAGNGIKRVEIT
jgi:hypothetical protein